MNAKHMLDLLDKWSIINQSSPCFGYCDHSIAYGLNLNVIIVIITVYYDQMELQWSALGPFNSQIPPMPNLPKLQRTAGAAKEPAVGQYMITPIQKKKTKKLW